jgi:hypothetical protein
MDPITGTLLAVGGNILSGLFGSRSQSRATQAQQQTAQQGFAAEQQIARENLAFQREMMNNMAMANMPRQQASNAALQHITDLYGLGDIYGAPAPGNLSGPANFYPGTNLPGAQGMAVPGMQGMQGMMPQAQLPQNVMGFHPGMIDYGNGGFGGGFSAGDMRIF